MFLAISEIFKISGSFWQKLIKKQSFAETTQEAQAKRKLRIPPTQATSGFQFILEVSCISCISFILIFPLFCISFSSSGGGFKKLMAKAKTIPVPRITGLAQVGIPQKSCATHQYGKNNWKTEIAKITGLAQVRISAEIY